MSAILTMLDYSETDSRDLGSGKPWLDDSKRSCFQEGELREVEAGWR